IGLTKLTAQLTGPGRGDEADDDVAPEDDDPPLCPGGQLKVGGHSRPVAFGTADGVADRPLQGPGRGQPEPLDELCTDLGSAAAEESHVPIVPSATRQAGDIATSRLARPRSTARPAKPRHPSTTGTTARHPSTISRPAGPPGARLSGPSGA